MFLKIVKVIFKSILILWAVVIFAVAAVYLLCPVYDFPEVKTFSGNVVFNPYKDIDSINWRKANFQLHTNAWGSLTDGKKNTPENVYKAYKQLGYDVISISDYQHINSFKGKDSSYIPVYEHGYNLLKNHQLAINASQVLWLDYPLIQNIHNKQDVLDRLREGTEFIALSHPAIRNAYTSDDLRVLSNYDFFEVLNHLHNSEVEWDDALSAGHTAFILADDDCHDITNLDEYGRCANIINSPSVNSKEILENLKAGKSYGIHVFKKDNESLEEKIAFAQNLEKLVKCDVIGDTLKINFSKPATEIRFIGQNGKIIGVCKDSDFAAYTITYSDTYVRTVAVFPSGNKIYLNPVFKSSGSKYMYKDFPKINKFKTILLRLIGFGVLGFLVFRFYRLIAGRNEES